MIQFLRGHWPNHKLEGEQSYIEMRLETALLFVRFAEEFRNTPEQISQLLVEITMMTENKKLEITKEDGELIIKREGEKGSKTIRIPGFKEKTEGLPLSKTGKVMTVSNEGSEPNGV